MQSVRRLKAPCVLVLQVAAAFLAAGWFAGCGGSSPSQDEAGAIQLSLSEAPAGLSCLRITVAGSRTVARTVPLVTGQATSTLLQGLPIGRVAVVAEAFPDACPALGPQSIPEWASDEVVVNLVAGRTVALQLTMRRQGRIDISIDWDTSDSPDGGGGGAGGAAPADGAVDKTVTDVRVDGPVATELVASPSSISFGNAIVGSSVTGATSIFTRIAGLVGPLTAVLTGPSSETPFFVVADTCTGIQIGNGPATDGGVPSSCFVQIRFLPNQLGLANALLTVTSPTASLTVPVTGTGIGALSLSMDPPSFAFDPVIANTAGASQSFTIANNTQPGGEASGGLFVSVSGEFQLVPGGTCGVAEFNLLPGDSCTVLLRFAPSAPSPGPREGLVQVFARSSNFARPATSARLTGTALAQVAVSPTTLDFGEVAEGITSDSKKVTVTNQGNSPVGTASTVASDFGWFSVDFAESDCPAILTMGDSCTMAVRVTPSFAAASQGRLQFTGDGVADVFVDLRVTGVAAARLVFVDAPQGAFVPTGGIPLGGSSHPVTFTLINAGAAVSGPITAAFVADDPGTSGEFVIDESSTCHGGDRLNPGQRCTFALKVVLAPGAEPGGRGANLSVAATPGGTVSTIRLDSNAVPAASALITPTPLDLGSAKPGDSGGTATITVTNNTDAPMIPSPGFDANVMVVQPGGDHPCLPDDSLAPSASCTLRVTFAPSFGVSPQVLSSGFAVGSAIGVVFGRVLQRAQLSIQSPLGGGFPDTGVGSRSGAQVFSVENQGDVPVAGVVTFSLEGTNAGDFERQEDNCTGLAAHARCTLSVVFKPQAIGFRSATLKATADDASAGAIGLSGNARPPAHLQIEPPTGSFVPTPVKGSSSVTLIVGNRPGAVASGILGLALADSSSFAVDSDSCRSRSLGGGETCRVNIIFTPQISGTTMSTLTISATPGGPVVVPLTGQGIGALTITPASGSLQAAVGQVSARSTFEIRNASNGPVFTLRRTALTGPDASQFRVVRDTCVGNVFGPASTCLIDVLFVPTTAGTKTAALTCASDLPTASVTAPLDGHP